ncbi:MAG: L-threonylcarbamoyladenylate synthase [Blastocatellia bacterium]
MKTKITQSPTLAARYIQHGETVAFPTETVYGLGANAFNEEAIRQIFTAKGRPSDNPLIVHIAQLHQIEQIVKEIPPIAATLIEKFFPGPLTVILPKSGAVPSVVTAGLETVGVRMPKHPIAIQFLRACGVPVAAPSANLSGRPSPTTWQAVRADLDGRIGCLLKGDPAKIGLESTVVDCTGQRPMILRAGGISLEQLRKVAPEVELADRVEGFFPKSPGLKYRHYSPRARIVVCVYPQYTVAVDDAAYIGLEAPPHSRAFRRMRICGNVEEYAQSLFQFFRECDEEGVETIYCHSVSREGLGLALMDRINRAAHE